LGEGHLEVSLVRRLLAEGRIKGKGFGQDWMVLSLDYQRRRAPKRKKGEVTWGELRRDRHL